MRKAILVFFLIGIPFPAFGQSSELPSLNYKPVPNFFKLPPTVHFGEVSGIAVNSKGYIFVFNRSQHALLEFNPDGNFIRSIGDGLFSNAHGLRIDAEDNIWTTDRNTHLVLKLSPDGQVLLVLGRKGRAGEWLGESPEKRGGTEWADPSTLALFNGPSDVAFGPEGNVFISDGYGNARVMKFDSQGKYLSSWGTKGDEPGQFNLPHGIVVDAKGQVYVADRENKRIQVFDSDGRFLKTWTHVGYPYGMYITSDQILYMTDARADRVLKLSLEGKILGVLGEPGKAIGQFGLAHGITVGPQDEIYVAELLNWRVQKFVKNSP